MYVHLAGTKRLLKKQPDPDVLIINTGVHALSKVFITAILNSCKPWEHNGWNPKDMYLVHTIGGGGQPITSFKLVGDVPYYRPFNVKYMDVEYRFTVWPVKDINKYLKDCLTYDKAIALSLRPFDKKGHKHKLYVHKLSHLAWALKEGASMQDIPDDTINWEAIKKFNNWNVLTQYIEDRQSVGRHVPRHMICGIVKAISSNLIAREVEEELTMMRMDG